MASFKEWLLWFHSQMAGRSVLLLLDNFSGHEKGVIDALEANTIRNTRIELLPPNSTSLFQTMDRGIINNLRVYYKQRLLEYTTTAALETVDEPLGISAHSNALSKISILQAIWWLCDVWYGSVKNETINLSITVFASHTFLGLYKSHSRGRRIGTSLVKR